MKQYDYELTEAKNPADGSDRQQILKEFFEADLEESSYNRAHDARLEEREQEGSKAYAVFVDDIEIGSVAPDMIEEVSEISRKASRITVTFGVNGRDMDDYERIVDRYKDRAFWKKEDPSFNVDKAKKDYDELMKELKEGGSYQATLHLITDEESDEEAAARMALSDDELKEYQEGERMIKQFKVLFIFSIVVLAVGILFLVKLSLIMGVLNIVFGLLGIYFSRRYTKRIKMVAEQRRQKREEEQENQG